jgi:hypothetical protein
MILQPVKKVYPLILPQNSDLPESIGPDKTDHTLYLDNNTSSLLLDRPIQTQTDEAYQWKVRLHRLYRAATSLLHDDSRWWKLSGCGSTPISADGSVSMFISPNGYKYMNTKVCGYINICPRCANSNGPKKKAEIRRAVENWLSQKGMVLMVTFTASFGKMTLSQSMVALQSAYTWLHDGEFYTKLRKDFFIIGEIKSTEITFNPFSSLFNPHNHTHLFLERKLKRSDVDKLEEILLERWQLALDGTGGTANGFGVKVTTGRPFEAGYLSKGVYFAHDPDRKTIWNLLETFADTGDMEMGGYFIEYAHATYRKPMLLWSKGLKDKVLPLKVSKQPTERKKKRGDYPIIRFERDAWKVIQAENRALDLDAIYDNWGRV